MTHCSKEQIAALQQFLNGKQKFPEELFPNKKGKDYLAAQNFEQFIVDIDTSFQTLSTLSSEITNGSSEAKAKAQQIRAHLKKRYGINLSSTNQNNEPIAANAPSSTIQNNAQNITNNITSLEILSPQQKNMS